MSNLHKGPIAWMARHGVAPNLLMAFLIIGGFLMSLMIRKEFIPTYEADMIIVTVSYPGATPTEMEQGVVLPIENELTQLDGFKEITSQASQSSARVLVALHNGTDKQQAYQDIQQAVNRISTFPADIERPVVRIASRTIDVMELTVFGNLNPFQLKRLAEDIKDELLESPEISKVEFRGLPSEEVHIDIPQQQLQRYGLTLQQVASAIRNNAIEQSAGSVRTQGGEILVTLDDRVYWARDFGDIPIVADEQGVQVRLADLATIKEGFADVNRVVTYDGEPAVGIRIFRAESQTPLTVVRAAYPIVERLQAALPTGVHLIISDDDGKTYQDRLSLLLKNAAIGLILVMILLSIFLEYRLAFWVTMGIPTAFLGAMLLLPAWDMSINMISMFAFIIALGIVVDDAIIAGENIYEHIQQGMEPMDAAVHGAREVAVPLAFAILTNIVAFLPLLALPGMMGKLFLAIPIVVICCFLISWIEALFIMPTHLGNLSKEPSSKLGKQLDRIQTTVDRHLQHFIEYRYRPFLQRCLRAPGITVAVAFAIAMLVMAYPMSGRMGFSMFPQIEGEYAVAKVELATNAPLSQAHEVRRYLEQSLRGVTDKIEAQGTPLVVSVEGRIQDSSVEIQVRLVDNDVRPVSAHELVELWRNAMGEIPGIRSLTFDSERGGGPSGGAALTLEIRGSNSQDIAAASADMAALLQDISTVKDVANGYASGKPQWTIELTDRGRSLGLQANDVAQQVRASLYGARALRQQRDRNEVTVLVRLPEHERTFRADIERLLITTPQGGVVPLSDVADLSLSRSPATINRRAGFQTVLVTADISPREQTPAVMAMIRSDLFPELQARYPRLDFDFRGRQADTQETLSAMQLYGLFSLLLIYVLLSIPFRSYSQPLLIMAIIPFGAVGAMMGHLLLGYSLSIMSIMGIVALAGVVVNDSLILVMYANQQKAERGLTALDAIVSAGVRRFRPILLTTLTTFGGLAPMVFETSRQAQFITPMAVSLGFGILFTTFVCLLVLPSFYLLLDRLQTKMGITSATPMLKV